MKRFQIYLTRNPQHVLCQLLLPPPRTGYNLRSHGHGLILPEVQFK